MTPILDRYEKALRFTGPKLAHVTARAIVEGLWADDTHYCFLREQFDSSIDRMVSTPTLVDCETGSMRSLIELRELASVLGTAGRRAIDLPALAAAEMRLLSPDRLVVTLDGQQHLVDLTRREVVASEPADAAPALFSPDGRYACFLTGHDLWLRDRREGTTTALTCDGAEHYCYGQPSETSLSAVTYRRRPAPLGLWSPDSRWFITHHIDERALPDLALLQCVPPLGGRPVVHTYKYAMPGESDLPIGTYVAVHVDTRRVVRFEDVRFELSTFSPFGLRRVWFGKNDTAWCVRCDRYSRRVELIRLDLSTGAGTVVFSEATDSRYLELSALSSRAPTIRVLEATDEVIWFSERDGWGQLYLHDLSTGALKNRVTNGEWQVRDLVHVDAQRRRLLFLAGGVEPGADPAWRSLCAVNFDGTGFEVLLAHEGDISIPPVEASRPEQSTPFQLPENRTGMSPNGRRAVVRFTSIERGNHTDLVELETRRKIPIAACAAMSGDVVARRFSALAADGVTRLHGILFLPSDFDESRRYPLIDYVYPGPQVAQQPQFFRSLRAAPAMALAELGFATLMLDTRGTPFGSSTFRQAAYGALLEPQLSDHAAVVRQLCRRHRYIDGERIGILGQSGGGAAAARALCDYGEIFKVGVAVCGNHDSRFYAAAWSDKHVGPGAGDDGGERANSTVADRLRGKLLLISGDMDENVHVGQTLMLVDALIRANRDFDLLLVPNAGHDVLISNGYVERRTWDYFVRHLLGETPPDQFSIQFEPHEMTRFKTNRARELQL